MRILIALTYYRPHFSGLTIYAEREARALARRGHQVTVLTSRYDPSLPAHEFRDGVEVVRPNVLVRISKGVIMPAMPFHAWRLARRADVVHLHAPQLDAAPISIVARLLGKPVVLTYHCDMQLPTGIIHRLANWASDAANHITAVSAAAIVHNTRDYAEHSPFLARYLEKLHPIYPPIELEPVTPEALHQFREKWCLQTSDRVIGMAARLATEKGVEYLAAAMPLVLEKYPTARVLFVGPYQNILGEEAYARRLAPALERLGNRWKFLGVVPEQEKAAFFHTCEVTVLPSINSTESYGMVQVESMACGAPVIASDRPGVRVPVQRTGMGRVVPAADARALAAAILEVLDSPGRFRGDPDPLLRLSTPEAVAQEYESLFQALMDKDQAKALRTRLTDR